MKIVQILPELNAGGVERGTLEIASFLVRQGHESMVVSHGGRMVAELENAGSRHIGMPVHRKNPVTLLQVLPLRKFLIRERPDILHIRSRIPGWVAWLAWRGLNPATRPRLVSTVHGFYSVNRYSSIMTRGERVIAVSESIRTYVLENYPDTPAENLRVIPRGIEPGDYGADFQATAEWLARWRSERPDLVGKCVLLLPGRITRLKGHQDFFNLIAALKKEHIPAHGLVAGDTHEKKRPYLDELRGIVAALGISADITFLGHRADIREVMSVSNLVHGQSGDSLIAFLTALLLCYEPIKRIAKMNVNLHASLIGVEMLYKVVDADHSIPDSPTAKPLQLTRGDIALRGVSFSYRPGQPVLHDVSLACPGGHVTALVGPSGSGKSTVLNLIERFYESDCGQIEIDGQDIRQLQTSSLREHMSLVSQDTFLFSDTLRNNIRFARLDATDAEVEAAARNAYAHEFILEQPLGYDTEVGENGGSLSGGQRQRISIARAFLKNAPILLLDEATSALDSESEQQIQLAFDRLMQGRTTIVIAHRFSTIRNARTIHVMQNGRLVASGSHDALISDSDSLYAHLYRLQYEQNSSAQG